MTEIGAIPLLTREQEVELGKMAQSGDQKAKDSLIEANLRLVVKVAKRYTNMGLPLMDLISEGNIGLMDAANRFDPNRFSNKFSTYAVWWIKRQIRHALITKSRMIRLPFGISRKMKRILEAQYDLEVELKRIPFDEEVAERVGMSVNALRSWMNFNFSPSLDEMSENGYDIAADSDSCDEKFEKEDLIDAMGDLLGMLSEKEQEVLCLRYGLSGNGEMDLKEVGKRLGLTGERVRQIQQKAIKKLQRMRKRANF